jgi:hypothetical protein
MREAEEKRLKTYMGHALDGEPELSGRFAKVSTTTVVGRSPVSYPAQPEGSPWRSDPCPIEPSLGFSVETVEPTGEKHEIEASVTGGTPVAEDGPSAVMSSPPRSGRGFLRRA